MDYVIVLGMEKGYNGFPSEKENDPIVESVLTNLEDYPHAEERRLFYVALTRVKKDIILVSKPDKKSPFIKELINDNKDVVVELNSNSMDNCEICPNCNDGYLIERGKYAYCTDSKFCKHKQRVKPVCKHCNQKLIYDREKGIAYCSEHLDFTIDLCPECDGYLQETQYDNYYGCSEQCGHTQTGRSRI